MFFMMGRKGASGMDDAEDAAIGWALFLNEEPDNKELRAEFERWLHENPLNAQAWRQVAAVSDIIRSAPIERRSVRKRSIMGWRLAQFWRSVPRAWRLTSGFGGAALACCLALLIAVPDLKVRFQADQYAPLGEIRIVQLADGSEVVLAPRSAIAIHMTDAERHVELVQGEAFFTVHHDAARLFTVQIGAVSVKDIGTAFDVQKAEHQITVRVREGAVHLASSAHPVFERDLHAGEWSSIVDGDIRAGFLPPETIGAWKDGLLIARDESVADLIKTLAPWMRGQTVLLHHAFLKERVTGVYDLHQPDEALRLIMRPFGAKVVAVSPWVHLVIAR